MALTGKEYLQSGAKRRLDIVAGSLAAICLAPIAVGVGAALTTSNRSFNTLFLQERSGGMLPHITTYKFRTLSKNIGSYATDKTFGTFDPRASRFAQFIRQSGLDELPQLLNVLEGKMSLVGPRPLTDADVNRFADVDPELFEAWYDIYTSSKPGLTGESQIMRHHYRDFDDDLVRDSMNMDIAYGRTASLATDLRLIAATPLGMIQSNIGVVDASEAVLPTAA